MGEASEIMLNQEKKKKDSHVGDYVNILVCKNK